MIKILLDAGHGGEDSGAKYQGDFEKDFALAAVLEIGRIIERQLPLGAVSYTRLKDKFVSLQGRAEIIMEINPDAFISVHCNSTDDVKANGLEIFYRDSFDLPLAQSVHRVLSRSDLWKKDRGVKQDLEWLEKRLTVLNNLPVPSILVEIGFLSNEHDREMIKANIPGISELIAHGILDFVGQERCHE